jgi:hypothetical protein
MAFVSGSDSRGTLFVAGEYTFTVSISSGTGQLTATSSVSLSMSPIESHVFVATPSPAIGCGQTKAFTAQALDPFGNTMTPEPDFTWAVASGGVFGRATGHSAF